MLEPRYWSVLSFQYRLLLEPLQERSARGSPRAVETCRGQAPTKWWQALTRFSAWFFVGARAMVESPMDTMG